jgi:hypothetical protein
LNGRRIVLLDVPQLEQQWLGLVWRGGKIDHQAGEHDDWPNAAAGALLATQQSSAVAIAQSWASGIGCDDDDDDPASSYFAGTNANGTLTGRGGQR